MDAANGQTEGRIAALDLLRGIAVLGIVTVNITSFTGAFAALYSPDLPTPSSPADHAVWLGLMVLFEGKMRALFSILFGASLLLFVERAEAKGRNGERLQFRRLGWLALFGYLHYLLLWEGDILFLYAVAGCIALPLRRAPPLALFASGLFLLTIWQGWGWMMWHAPIATEQAVQAGLGTAEQTKTYTATIARYRLNDRDDLAQIQGGGTALIAHKGLVDAFRPLRVVFYALGETLSLVLIGMALFKAGMFAGHWRRRSLTGLALGGITLGGLATGAFATWAGALGYPEITMRFALNYGLSWPHLAMALGYAAALMLAAPAVLRTRIGGWLVSAGRMAFSNYIGTSLVLCGLCYGWGLGWAGQLSLTAQATLAALIMALMLIWSALWLGRFRQGPLEWLWRSLTEGRWLAFKS